MATLTKANLVDKLRHKGVSVPPSSPKETLVRLYRQHFPGSDTTRDDLLDFSSDEEADSQESSLPAEVSPRVRSLTNDQLYSKLKEFGEPVGPIVETTRGVYEKRLQQYLNSTQQSPTVPLQQSPSQPASTTAEFSATEEEAEDDEDDDDDGTPLQDVPVSRLGLSSSGGFGVRPGFTASRGGMFGTADAVESPLTSRTSAAFTRAGAPVQTSLRARMGATNKEELGRGSNHVQAPSGQQQQSARKSWSPLLIKVAIGAVVVLVNVLIYANLEYFKSDVPVPSFLK
uniref:Putative conserved plasma membrane protein n=1 Tax=Amblyomma aureolatum TaxID=187763 RepID=A0A1E1XGH6_9ACAR